MYFLSYKETDVEYIYNSTIRSILLRQNLIINNSSLINLPKIDFMFLFKEIIDISILKLENNIIFLWLITGKVDYVKKLWSKLDRGIRYFWFIIKTNIDNLDYYFKFIDFMVNVFFNFLGRSDYRGSLNYFSNFNCYQFFILDLEFISNIRLSSSYYTNKVDDELIINFFLKTKLIKINYLLKQLKFPIK